ncbi:Histone-lysine N-methyltransferase, H3 lysine-36 specific [Frankliniella fusca]|uniref:Histone-lysine N-methyltransferase, H3 lysine-36 specific n=1 Tax=Frankliniella fusca TaxID=407009 RepID=A0AAE1HR05_9NEOP|nr:Histone-lysine N-methyltransferase, H3 lysine-36 specific [Frankliniella fusca]
MEIHRIVVQHFVGLQIGDPTFRRICLQCIQAATSSLFWAVLNPSFIQFEQFVPAILLTEDWFYCCHCCLEPCYLVLQNDVFANGLYRAEDFANTPLVPQVPPPGIVYPGGLVAEPEYVDLTMED